MPDDAASLSAEAFAPGLVAAWWSLSPASVAPRSLRLVRKWGGDPASSSFAPPCPDPSLHAAFESFHRSSKPIPDLASSSTASSGAAAHAVLRAIAKIDALKETLRAALPPGADADWRRFFDESVAQIQNDVLPPLHDASKILASGYGRGVAAIRNGVIAAAAPSIQSFLKTFPLADHYFFGNPTQQLTASMNYPVMVASLTPKPAAPRHPPPASRPPARPALSTPAKGKASGRSFRGGKAGQKK